jgi:hypothetical protein
MLTIKNDGREITQTNYWDTEHALCGYCYLSWNAGAARLLVPDALQSTLQDMTTAEYVIVSRGPWPEQGGRDALELLFEDGTDSPFCLHLSAEQTDRLLPEEDQGGLVVSVWTRAGWRLTRPGKYRIVQRIPCLDPWVEQ